MFGELVLILWFNVVWLTWIACSIQFELFVDYTVCKCKHASSIGYESQKAYRKLADISKKTRSLSVISLCLPYKEDPHWFSDTGFLWWMEIVCYRNTWAKKRTYVRGVEFCAFLCCSELLFHIGGGSCDPFTKELWGLVKELLNWSCKDRLLDDWGQLVASFIHCYHGLRYHGGGVGFEGTRCWGYSSIWSVW